MWQLEEIQAIHKTLFGQPSILLKDNNHKIVVALNNYLQKRSPWPFLIDEIEADCLFFYQQGYGEIAEFMLALSCIYHPEERDKTKTVEVINAIQSERLFIFCSLLSSTKKLENFKSHLEKYGDWFLGPLVKIFPEQGHLLREVFLSVTKGEELPWSSLEQMLSLTPIINDDAKDWIWELLYWCYSHQKRDETKILSLCHKYPLVGISLFKMDPFHVFNASDWANLFKRREPGYQSLLLQWALNQLAQLERLEQIEQVDSNTKIHLLVFLFSYYRKWQIEIESYKENYFIKFIELMQITEGIKEQGIQTLRSEIMGYWLDDFYSYKYYQEPFFDIHLLVSLNIVHERWILFRFNIFSLLDIEMDGPEIIPSPSISDPIYLRDGLFWFYTFLNLKEGHQLKKLIKIFYKDSGLYFKFHFFSEMEKIFIKGEYFPVLQALWYKSNEELQVVFATFYRSFKNPLSEKESAGLASQEELWWFHFIMEAYCSHKREIVLSDKGVAFFLKHLWTLNTHILSESMLELIKEVLFYLFKKISTPEMWMVVWQNWSFDHFQSLLEDGSEMLYRTAYFYRQFTPRQKVAQNQYRDFFIQLIHRHNRFFKGKPLQSCLKTFDQTDFV